MAGRGPVIMAFGIQPDLRLELEAPSLFAGVYRGSFNMCWNLVGGGVFVVVLEPRVLIDCDPGSIDSSSMYGKLSSSRFRRLQMTGI